MPLLDAEKIVGDYLKDQPAVEALKARVVSKTPSTLDLPWVRITLLTPTNVTGTTRVEWLMAYYLQFDCYAGRDGGRPEAFALAAAVRSALVEMPTVELPDAVATDAAFPSMPKEPDPDIERERYVIDGELWMHPKP